MKRTSAFVFLVAVAIGVGLAALPRRASAGVSVSDLPTECPERVTVGFNVPNVKGFHVGVGPSTATFSNAMCDHQAKIVQCIYELPGTGKLPAYVVDFPKGLVGCKTEGRKLLWTF